MKRQALKVCGWAEAQKPLMIAVSALSLSVIGCSSADGEDDTDNNKSFYIDDYQEASAPAPATGDAACSYAAAAALGAAGVGQGQIVPVTHSWEGFRPGENEPSLFSIAELFDCDGSRGIDAIIVDVSQYG